MLLPPTEQPTVAATATPPPPPTASTTSKRPDYRKEIEKKGKKSSLLNPIHLGCRRRCGIGNGGSPSSRGNVGGLDRNIFGSGRRVDRRGRLGAVGRIREKAGDAARHE